MPFPHSTLENSTKANKQKKGEWVVSPVVYYLVPALLTIKVAISVSPGSLMDMQNLKPHFYLLNQNLYFNEILR